MTEDAFRLEQNASGRISASFVSQRGGRAIPVLGRPNVITLEAADIMARLVAGAANAAPSHIGVVYGSDALPSFVNPEITRDHDWESLAEEVGAVGGNIAIMPLSLTPSVSGRVATFSANSGTISRYGFDGAPYAGPVSTLDPLYFYQVVLLDAEHRIFARSTLLDSGVYRAKPEDYDLAIQWAITFK